MYSRFLVSNSLWIYSFLSPIFFLMISAWLGLITPGYDMFSQTISSLVNMKYGFVQQINFLQFGISFIVSGQLLARHVINKASKRLWLAICYLCAIFIFGMVLFPTDQLTQFSKDSLTLTGGIHYGATAIFFLLAPVGVYLLWKTLKLNQQCQLMPILHW